MKYSIIFTTIIALSLYSFTVSAGTVTGLTSYTGGTTLNASDLNNDNTQIKSAVDDNNSKIGANTLDIDTNFINIEANTSDISINSDNISSNTVDISNIPVPASVKQTPGDIWLTLPTSATGLQSLTVTPPANGYLLVTATGSVSFSYTTGSGRGFICVDLSDTADDTGGCTPMAGSKSAYRSFIPDGFPTTSGFGSSYSLSELFSATEGTPVTFYISGYATGLDLAALFHSTITVMFVPNNLQ